MINGRAFCLFWRIFAIIHLKKHIMKSKLSPLVEELRGKFGQSVAATGRGGSYFRARVIPFNPKSDSQLAARSRLTTYSQAWAGLTENQRTQWNDAVDSWKNTDVFGVKLTPSGFNLYVALNSNLSVIGGTPLTVPPAIVAVPTVTVPVVTQVHSGATVFDVAEATVPAGCDLILEATEPMSQGRNSAGSKYRIITVINGGTSMPFTATTVYATKFGGPGLAGQKVFMRVTPIENTTGKRGASLTCSCVVS